MNELPVNVEFIINNQELKASTKEAKADITGVGQTAEEVSKKVNQNVQKVLTGNITVVNTKDIERANAANEALGRTITKISSNLKEQTAATKNVSDANDKQVGILGALNSQYEEYKQKAFEATDPTRLELYNAKLQEIRAEIIRLSNVGKQGFDDLGNKMVVAIERPIGSINRLKFAMKGYSDMIATSSNPEIIAKYNKKLQESQIELGRLQNIGKSGFDQLGNKIVVAEKNTKTFVGTLSTGIERLRRLAYIIPGLGIAGILSLALGPLMKWISSIGQATEAQKLFNSARQGAATSIAKEVGETKLLIDEINSNNISQKEKQALLDEFIAKNPNVLGALNLQNIATQEGKLAIDQYIESLKEKISLQALEKAYLESVQKSADLRSGALSEETDFKWYNTTARTIGDMLTFRRTYEETQADIKKINEERRKDASKTQDVVSESLLKEIESERAGRKAIVEIQDTSLKALETQLATTNTRLRNLQKGESAKTLLAEKANLEQQIKQREKLLGIDKKTIVNTREVNAAFNLQQKIYDLKAEFTRKAMSKDEEELRALRDKFVKMAEEVQHFNANPKNKVKVSTSGLEEVRDLAIADLQFKHETEKLKIALTEQKKLYQDYEDYKISLGKDKADEKYRDQIDTEKSYLENLRDALSKIPEGELSGSQQDRKEDLEKRIKEEELIEAKKFTDLLKANQAYQDKVITAIELFESEKKALLEKGKVSEVETLTKTHNANLESLAENHIKQLDAYKNLYDGIEYLSNDSAKNVIENAKKMLAENDMPKALRLKVLALIAETERSLDNRIYDRVGEIGAAFDEMASGADGLNENLTNTLKILGDVLHAASTVGKSIGDIKTGIADYSKNKADAGGGVLGTIAGVSAIAGPIGAAVGAVSNLAKGIVNVFKASKESRIQAERELAEFDNQKRDAEFEINILYRERLRTQLEINDATLNGIKESKSLLESQSKEIENDYNRLFSILQGEQFVSGKKTEKHGGVFGLFRKTRTVDEMGSLTGKTYDDIEKLFVSNQLSERAKELFVQLQNLKKEGADIDKMLSDNTKKLWEKATGTTSESIKDSIIKGFENGYRSAEDFAEDFKGLMNQASKEFFKDFVQNQEMEAFYKRFAEKAQNGPLDDNQRAELKYIYDQMIGRIGQKYDDLKDITGEDFLATDSQKKSGIKGAFERTVTESSANEWIGLGRATYELTEKSLELENKHLNATMAMLRHSAAIEKNTSNTVTELQNAVVELKTIAKNTKTGQTDKDLGI